MAVHGANGEEVPEQANGVAAVTSPPLFGLGLLAAVPDSVLARLEDPEDRNSDGISGRRGVTEDGRSGRFGRKAEVHSLEDFVDTALRFETRAGQHLLTRSRKPSMEFRCPWAWTRWRTRRLMPGEWDCLRTTSGTWHRPLRRPSWVRYRIRSRPANPCSSPAVCTACHIPALPVESAFTAVVEAEAFTDLLLHDLGPEIADVCGPGAAPSEYRTAPLWGLRFRSELLHDGSAGTVEEAVLKHGGEASQARSRFFSLSDADRRRLFRFLSML